MLTVKVGGNYIAISQAGITVSASALITLKVGGNFVVIDFCRGDDSGRDGDDQQRRGRCGRTGGDGQRGQSY